MPTFPTCRRRLPAPLEARGATMGGASMDGGWWVMGRWVAG